jgi:hypothetical protein
MNGRTGSQLASTTGSDPQEAVHQEVWLLGQPPLTKYMKFVEEMVVDGVPTHRAALVAEWCSANEYYADLEKTEAGIADKTDVFDLDPVLRPLAEKVMADTRYQRSFDRLPTRFAMVELDTLIIGHPYVSLHHVERLKGQIGPSPSPEALFRFCLPLDRSEAPVKVRQVGPQRYLFWSRSSDFRFKSAAMLDAEQINALCQFGTVSGGIGLFVGYGSNFLNVIQSDQRMLVNNGHHRAYALRDLGITHAPSIVQTVASLDELTITAARAVLDKPAFYFAAKRPPILKDFFDPKIRKVVRVQSMMNLVEVSFEAKLFKKIKDFGEPDDRARVPEGKEDSR